MDKLAEEYQKMLKQARAQAVEILTERMADDVKST